jgi:hypothetical protein
MQTGKFTTFNRKFPLSEEEGNIGANELLLRGPGETPYQTRTRFDKMRDRALILHLENIRRHVRLFEVLAQSSIMTGKMPAILGTTNTDLMYDFKRRAAHTITADIAWDASGATILADIDEACDLLEANGNISPDMLCIGGTAFSAMIHDSTFQALADNRRLEFIQAGRDLPVPANFSRFVASGWIPQGRLRTPKGYSLWVFTYNRTYHNASGVSTKLMTEGKAFITSTEARFDRYFGPPETLPMTGQRQQQYRELFGFDVSSPPMPMNILNAGAIIDPAMFYCDAYVASDYKNCTIRTQSAPIFATTQTDAIVVLQGLVT